jgi:histone deacetylase 1/2
MSQFHTDEYVDFLNRVTPDNVDQFVREQSKCEWMLLYLRVPHSREPCHLELNRTSLQFIAVNVGDDCPVFDGLFEYCSISAGGSMGE